MTAVGRPRLRLAVVGLVAVGALGLLGASGIGDSLVYYRAPSEDVGTATPGEGRIRLGGMVQAGSVRPEGSGVRFVLTDGAADVTVVHRGDPSGVFQEGQGALVEGEFDGDGIFRSDFLVVKHSNEYRAADGSVYRAPSTVTGP